MPIHLSYQGTICSSCGTDFISYPQNNHCPKCGRSSDESCDFIVATIATMKDHKQVYGQYFPETWFSGSTADLVQGIIFELFDNLEIEKPKDINDFLLRQLKAVEWEEDQKHLASQINQIALQVYDLYKSDPDFRSDNLKTKPLNPKLKHLQSSPSESVDTSS